jgi:hypothetical protein
MELGGHAKKQKTRWFGSVWLLTQAPPQQTGELAGHCVPHFPQLVPSNWRSTQALPHIVCPAGQAHWPPLQFAPDGQAWPQFPQLLESVCRITQALPHAVWPVGQISLHCPFTQLCPLAQRVPQPPQLFGSVLALTQLPLQRVSWLFVQTQFPPAQL